MRTKRTDTIPFAEFKKIYSRVPRLCVELILIENGKILLTRRSIPPEIGKWHTPGGTVLWGESLKDAVRGVAKDELGSDVTVGKMLGIIEYGPWSNHFTQDFGVAFLIKRRKAKSKIHPVRNNFGTVKFQQQLDCLNSIDNDIKNYISNGVKSHNQAEEHRFFDVLPANTIAEQKEFLVSNLKFKVSKKPV